MNKKVLMIAVALIVAISASSIAPALAESVRSDYQYAGGVAVIDVPGHPKIRLTAMGLCSRDFGRSDRIHIQVDTNPTGDPNWVYVSAYEDNPERCAWSASLGGAAVQNLAKRWQIGVFRICKTNFVYWRIPLIAPATDDTPEVVLPPGFLVLRGYGEINTEQVPPVGAPITAVPIGTAGWYFRIESSYYDADATLFCRGWRYCGPVGEDFDDTRSVKNNIWTWFDYNPDQ